MAKRRSFVRKGEAEFNGWGCSACEWVHPYPRPKTKDPGAEAYKAFDAHECEKNSKRKPREDVPQAT